MRARILCGIQPQDVELLAKNYMTNKGDVHFMVRTAIVHRVPPEPPVFFKRSAKPKPQKSPSFRSLTQKTWRGSQSDWSMYRFEGRKLKIQQTTQLFAETWFWCSLGVPKFSIKKSHRFPSQQSISQCQFNVCSKQLIMWVCLKIVYPMTQWFCWSLSLLNG